MDRETPGEKLVSPIVFIKLPSFFKREMIRLSGSNYTSICFLIEHFSDAIRTLECTRNNPVDRPKHTVCKADFSARIFIYLIINSSLLHARGTFIISFFPFFFLIAVLFSVKGSVFLNKN